MRAISTGTRGSHAFHPGPGRGRGGAPARLRRKPRGPRPSSGPATPDRPAAGSENRNCKAHANASPTEDSPDVGHFDSLLAPPPKEALWHAICKRECSRTKTKEVNDEEDA